MKKGQVVSFDMLSGVLLFLIFIAIFILVFFLPRYETTPPEFEAELLFTFENLETNLQSNPEIQFLRDGYRVRYAELQQFYGLASIDEYFLEGPGGTSGIALFDSGYDICLYFTDNDNTLILVNNLVAAGTLVSQSCDDAIRAGQNPCDGYARAMTTFRPVLFIDSPSENRIVQMNVVACKL